MVSLLRLQPPATPVPLPVLFYSDSIADLTLRYSDNSIVRLTRHRRTNLAASLPNNYAVFVDFILIFNFNNLKIYFISLHHICFLFLQHWRLKDLLQRLWSDSITLNLSVSCKENHMIQLTNEANLQNRMREYKIRNMQNHEDLYIMDIRK